MTTQLKIIEANRKQIADIFSGLNEDQLNKIPVGFSNNLAWHLMHLIATFESLTYKMSGLPMHITDDFLNQFKGGTKPEAQVQMENIQDKIDILLSQPIELFKQLSENKFTRYTEFTTRIGVGIKNIDDAVNFIVFHEGIHYGYILALKRVVLS